MTIDLNTHDLDLPDWGPFSKRYGGISHIPDISQGLRFDLAVMPGYYRRQMIVPNEKWASGQHAWEASIDLTYYSYRYEIEWKDQVYCDVSFSAITETSRLIRCSFVNNTNLSQDLMIHFVASMNFPPVRPYSDDWIKMVEVKLPRKGFWLDALDYNDLQFFEKRPTDNLVEDGLYRAEIRDHGLTNGNGIGCDFGKGIGDRVNYIFELEGAFDDAKLVIRFRLVNAKKTVFKLEGLTNRLVNLEQNISDEDEFGFSVCEINLGPLKAKFQYLKMESLREVGVDFDGFAFVEVQQEITFEVMKWKFIPEILQGPTDNSLILKYEDADIYYGIAWTHHNPWIRQLFNNELDNFMRQIVPDHMSAIKHGPGEGHFTDIFLRPIYLAPKSNEQTYSFVCSGSKDDITRQLNSFSYMTITELENHDAKMKQKAISLKSSVAGSGYQFSQNKMAATEMLNVVYPVYTRRQFIRHNTPGKWWDCLYTWDSGFIGLALLELDKNRALENLNAYVTPEGDKHAAFIHHGSPVPTQIYLYNEIWNQTQDSHALKIFYSSMKQYYQYLAGHIGGSTTRELKSNLLRTWEYFFDSGGWDDYPAQLHALEHEKTTQITCSSITAHVIRSAKILKSAATELGQVEDIPSYEKDIDMFERALNKHAWDDKSGYFSYVVHNEKGQPTAHLTHSSGYNFNMGLDGVLPLFAGICNSDQERVLVQKLMDPRRLWTSIGLSTVDQSAPYYKKDGYWNGAVWMPQQWFIWKTALDLGLGEFAQKIALTALDLWKAEVENSYYCFEHFLIESQRGTGWHQFGGLSSPVLSWFNAYFKVGRLTVGMDVWVRKQQFESDSQEFMGILESSNKRTMTAILNMNENYNYNFYWNDKLLQARKLNKGSYELNIEFTKGSGTLVATRNNRQES